MAFLVLFFFNTNSSTQEGQIIGAGAQVVASKWFLFNNLFFKKQVSIFFPVSLL